MITIIWFLKKYIKYIKRNWQMFGKFLVLNIMCLITSSEHPQRHSFDDNFYYCRQVFLATQLTVMSRKDSAC